MLYPISLSNEKMKLYLRSYEICMGQYYIPEHFDTNEGLDILVSDGISGLMSAEIQSRHSSGKQHMVD